MHFLHAVLSDGKLRTDAHGSFDARAKSITGLLETAIGPLRLRDAEFAVRICPEQTQARDCTTFSFFSDSDNISLTCPDFVFAQGDYATTCAQISVAGTQPPEAAKLGWAGVPTTAAHDQLAKLAGTSPETIEMLAERPGVSGLTIEQQARRWQYLIDLPGRDWEGGLKLRLWSGRVPFVIERPSREWFSPLLQPWRHYVPVKPDLSDLEDNLDRLARNPAQQEIIAANALSFARKHLTRDAAVARWRELLQGHFGRNPSAAKPGVPLPSSPTPASNSAAPATPVAANDAPSPALIRSRIEEASEPATFVVVAPAYVAHSAGVSLLHRLCHTINGLGFRAYMMILSKNSAGQVSVGFGTERMINPAWNTPLFLASHLPLLRRAYVIYPEGIATNPLRASRVIRYFLNREGFFGDPQVALQPDDFLVAFHRIFRPDAHHILSDFPLNPVFNNEGTRPAAERTLDVTYVGKGEFDGPVQVVENTLYIARHWPVNQQQLAMVLKQARYVFSWDAMSAFNVDALLCGAQPVLLRHGRWTPEELAGTQLGRIPWIEPSDTFQRHPKFDQATLDRERERILDAMKEHGADWNGRVMRMLEQAIRHFAGRARSAGTAVAA